MTRLSWKASAPIIPFSSRGSAIDIPEEHPELHHTTITTAYICAPLQRELLVRLIPDEWVSM